MKIILDDFEYSVLNKLVLFGPLLTANVENLAACDRLLEFNLAVKIVVKDETCYIAATHLGNKVLESQ